MKFLTTALLTFLFVISFHTSVEAKRNPRAGRTRVKPSVRKCKIEYFGRLRHTGKAKNPRPGTRIVLEYHIKVQGYARCKVRIKGIGRVPVVKKVKKDGSYTLKGVKEVKIDKSTTYKLEVLAYRKGVKPKPISYTKECRVNVALKMVVMTNLVKIRPDARTAWGGYIPQGFGTTVYRVRWNKKGIGWATADGFGFWGSVHYERRKKMYISEVWGPRGSGMFRNKLNHDQSFYISKPRPQPQDIQNVFLFCCGQAGLGRPAVTTGQGEAGPFKGRGRQTRYQGVRIASWAGQLLLHYKRYKELYNPSNTLLATAVQTQYDIATSDKELRNIANGFYNYLASRSNNFRCVKTIWLGGNSRGGALSLRLAKMIKSRIVDRSIRPPSSLKIIVTTSDAVSARNDHLADRGHVRIWNGRSDADKHDFEALFPGGEWVKNLHIRLAVGASRGVDSMVHKSHTEYNSGLRGNFFSQVFDDRSHKHMCKEWHRKNGDEMLAFFFEKAFGAKDYKRVGF